jgi:hypothetical protein
MIQDLVAPFAAFADEKPGDDMTVRWQNRVVEPHAEIYRAIEPWMGVADAGRRLPELVQSRDALLRRARRAQEAAHRAHSLLRQALPDAGRINAVVLVGLGQANGWATLVNGTPTLFLAVDRLPEPGKLRKALEPYLNVATRVGRSATNRIPTRNAAPTSRSNRDQNQAIREWAGKNGYEVSERGRIPSSIVEAFHKNR